MKTIIIFTSKTKEMIVDQGGSGWWVVAARSLRNVSHVLVCHNAHDPRRPGDPARHGEAFLIGKFAGYAGDDPGRKLVKMSAVADLCVPGFWGGNRNPVRYAHTEDVAAQLRERGIYLESLVWQELAEQEAVQPVDESTEHSAGRFIQNTLQSARFDIAEELGLPVEQVRLTLEIDTGNLLEDA